MSDITADVTLDFKGMTCPHPIVEAKKILDQLEKGKVMQLISNCAGTKDDMKSWTEATGNSLLAQEEMGDGIFSFYIEKG
jgi:TusA-related sulfurtransferase